MEETRSRTTRDTIAAAVLLLLATAVGPPLHAQEPASPELEAPAMAGVMAGTVLGSAMGSVVIGGAFWLLTGGGGDGVYAAGLAFPLGYAAGGAVGSASAASSDAARVSASSMIGPSLLGTGIGLGVFLVVGDAFDSEDRRGEAGDTSWYVGTVLAVTAHALTTAGWARGKARAAFERQTAGLRVIPLVKRGELGLRLELVH